ncbi:MAG: ribose ABC transporter permease [Candidatus Roseilinea sp.]|nr:MAG: ribose ABC transporter permease [Candidatus Roseilinea sp.]
MEATAVSPKTHDRSAVRAWLDQNRRGLSAFAIFLGLWAFFLITAPGTFTDPQAYRAIFTTLPIDIILAASLVFVITSGESDLSFPSVFGLASYVFALLVSNEVSPVIALIAALIAGIICGLLNGLLITRIGLSSLVATLGMNFFLRGLINVLTQGIGIPLTMMVDTPFYNVLVGQIGEIPIMVIWAALVLAICVVLFNRHKLGAHVAIVGDNPESAKEMGISVARTKTLAYVIVGLCAAFAGVLSSLVNNTWWPTAGDGYLLRTLAAVFIGGTPTWGGVGTVIGAMFGAMSVGFIETGLIGAGLTAFWTQFAYGLVIILALIGHRFNQGRYR